MVLLFRLVFLALLAGAVYLLLARVFWPSIARRGPKAAYWSAFGVSLLSWLLPLMLGVGPFGEVPVIGPPLRMFAIVWTVSALAIFCVGVPVVVLRRVASGWSKPEVIDPKRRALLTRMGGAVPVIAVATGATGVAAGLRRFVVREETIEVPGLPEALDGFRVGQLTDVHIGPFVSTDDLREAVRALDEAGVHLQVTTGDLIDDLDQIDDTVAALASTRARHGAMAILGNHEHWQGASRVIRGFSRSPVRLLIDENVTVEHEGGKLCVVGVDYPMRHRGPRSEVMRRSAEKAFSGAEPGAPVLCLSHHPDFFPVAAERGAALTLAGHTHGGQVKLFGVPAFFFAFEHILGRYRRGDSHLYVSGGTGHWMPFRLGVPTEVTVLTLRRARA